MREVLSRPQHIGIWQLIVTGGGRIVLLEVRATGQLSSTTGWPQANAVSLKFPIKTCGGRCAVVEKQALQTGAVFYTDHVTSISCKHWCHPGACYYRMRCVTKMWLVTPNNSLGSSLRWMCLLPTLAAVFPWLALLVMENGTLLLTAQVFSQTLVNKINPSSSLNEIQSFDTLLCETAENKPYKIIGFGGMLVVVIVVILLAHFSSMWHLRVWLRRGKCTDAPWTKKNWKWNVTWVLTSDGCWHIGIS